MFDQCTWLRMYPGSASSGHFQSFSVLLKSSSLREGVGNPTYARPSICTPTALPFLLMTLVTGSTAVPSISRADGGSSWVR